MPGCLERASMEDFKILKPVTDANGTANEDARYCVMISLSAASRGFNFKVTFRLML
jgi:hypothetical protein